MSIRLTAAGVTRALGSGPLAGSADRVFSGVTIDSRRVLENQLFVAIRGPRFDGSDFVAAAVAAGATGVVASARSLAGHGAATFWSYDDGVRALQRIARVYRNDTPARFLGITGSNGKTTTKELVLAVLSQRFVTHGTRGNLNNQIGTPLTLLEIQPETEWAVIEIGTSEPGEIPLLAALVRPEMAIITGVAESHLEGLGSIEAVLEEKLALGRALSSTGTLFYNGDDRRLRAAVGDLDCRIVSYGLDARNDISPETWALDEEGRGVFDWGGRTFRLRLVGKHNVVNALAAVAVGRELDISAGAIAGGLAEPEPLPLRMQVERWGGVVALVDCYNANPHSVESAVETLGALDTAGRRIAVLGEMRELGAESRTLHERVGRQLAEAGIDLVVSVGPVAGPIAEGAEDGGLPAVRTEDRSAAARWLIDNVQVGDALLFKASRGAALEDVVEQVRDACVGCSLDIRS